MISSVVSLAVALPRARFNQASASRRRVAAAGFISTPPSASSNVTSVSGNKPNFSRSACGIVTWPLLVSFTVILSVNQSYSSREAFPFVCRSLVETALSSWLLCPCCEISGYVVAAMPRCDLAVRESEIGTIPAVILPPILRTLVVPQVIRRDSYDYLPVWGRLLSKVKQILLSYHRQNFDMVCSNHG